MHFFNPNLGRSGVANEDTPYSQPTQQTANPTSDRPGGDALGDVLLVDLSIAGPQTFVAQGDGLHYFCSQTAAGIRVDAAADQIGVQFSTNPAAPLYPFLPGVQEWPHPFVQLVVTAIGGSSNFAFLRILKRSQPANLNLAEAA